MPESKCPKCVSEKFELVPAKIENCQYDYNFVQCSECSVVVGVLEAECIAHKVGVLMKKLREMEGRMNQRLVNLVSEM